MIKTPTMTTSSGAPLVDNQNSLTAVPFGAVLMQDFHLLDAQGQVSLQTSAEFVRTYNAQAHEMTDAITAVVINAEAGLHLLRAQSPDLEQVRQALNSIANDGKRAGDVVVRTRALMNE